VRVTVHTAGVLVEEYDVPDKLSGAADADILAAVRRKRPTTSHREDVGDPIVYSRGGDAVDEAAAAFVAAREAFDVAKERAKAAATAAADADEKSEHELGRLFGVDRLTIRSWRGKGR
jgi:hypothetical protein